MMARHAGPVLVDTNIILESYRVGSWRALAGGYNVETVEECVDETQSLWAHARKRDDAWILCGPDRASLRCGVRLGFRERLVSLERLPHS